MLLLLQLLLPLLPLAATTRAGWKKLLRSFIESDSSVFFIQTRFVFNVPLVRTVAFTASIFQPIIHIIHPRQLRACAEARRALARRGGEPLVIYGINKKKSDKLQKYYYLCQASISGRGYVTNSLSHQHLINSLQRYKHLACHR